ncbi:MAG: cation:proton antiporter [Chloroflexota bacterium]
MNNIWFGAAAWMGLAFLASLISIRLGISVSLIEISVGILAGNFFGLQTNDWVNFLASFGSVVLTFLAGAELEPQALRSHLKESLSIGFLSFLLPFVAAFCYAYFVAGWSLGQAEIAGIALSTTSVAVVYAVMVETGLNQTSLGKAILAACFVTDLGTVLALGLLFAHFDIWMLVFILIVAPTLFLAPRLTRWVIRDFGGRISEPETKFLLLLLFALGGVIVQARSEAVLPAYLIGLVLAGVFLQEKILATRIRTIAFSILTPFYFIKAGLFVRLDLVVPSIGLIIVLFLVKVVSKSVGVWPLSKAFKFTTRKANYTTLLMATGLTFGTISALYGLTNKIIDQGQYTVLVTVVILSAVVPTLVAQRFFSPDASRPAHLVQRAERVGSGEDLGEAVGAGIGADQAHFRESDSAAVSAGAGAGKLPSPASQ